MEYDLTVIIACYNEELLLEESVRQIENILNKTIYKYELLFIDDNSKDKTRELIKKIANGNADRRFFFHEKNIGRGGTVVDGIKAARGKIVGFLDIDLEVHARYIPSMVSAIEQGYDVATAYRFCSVKMDTFDRDISSRIYHMITRFYLKIPLNDTETGYKFFNKEKIMPIIEKTKDKRWFWDTEIMAISCFENLKIVEIPCLFLRRKDKKSSVSLFHDSWEYLVDVVRFKSRLKNEGYYKKMLHRSG
jgi:glycosyltransferase AglD